MRRRLGGGGAQRARPGDRILLSGTIGDHGVAIMACREGLDFASSVRSDTAALHDLVAAMVAALQLLNTASVWPAIVSCRSFWMALRTMALNIGAAARTTGVEVLSKDTTLEAFARAHNNSVPEIMALNAAALRGPYAPRGMALSYYLTN